MLEFLVIAFIFVVTKIRAKFESLCDSGQVAS